MGESASPQIIGRYTLHGEITSDAVASLHFGRLQGSVGFSRTVAVKRLHSRLAERAEILATMVDEARLAARIQHPNVVPVIDVVATEGELLVVMEYVRGESLARLLRALRASDNRVPLPIATSIVVGALHGLHAAHKATSDRGTPLQIVHRDICPQNILVGVDGAARVIDFGAAAGRLQATREGIGKNRIAYAAPEQLAAEGDVTRWVDIYAMAVVLWETIAGRPLFDADNDSALVEQVLAGVEDPPSLHAPDVPPQLDALILKGLAREPADRFASAREMADALVRVVTPAFPTDVGAWVEEVARETLAKRAKALAEIEGRSRMPSVLPPASMPGIKSFADRSAAQAAPPPQAPAEPKSAAEPFTVPHILAAAPASDDASSGAPSPAGRAGEASTGVRSPAGRAGDNVRGAGAEAGLSVEWIPAQRASSGSAAREGERETRPGMAKAAGVLVAIVLLAGGAAALAWHNGGASPAQPSGASATAPAEPPAALPTVPPPSYTAAAAVPAPASSASIVGPAASSAPRASATAPANRRPAPRPAPSIRFAEPD